MPFRILIVASFGLFILNLDGVFGLGAANALVKSVLLLACFAFLIGRSVNMAVIALLGVVLLMVFALGALTDYPDFSWGLLLGALNQIVVIYLLLAARPTPADRDALLRMAAWLPVACALLGVLYQVAGLRTAFPIEFNTGQGRFAGTLNAAFLSGLCMCGIFASLKLTDLGRSSYYALIPVQAVILLMTGARVALAVTLSVAGTAFYSSRQRSFKMKLVGTGAGVALAAVLVPFAWARYAARAESSGLSGRDIMWPWLLSLSEKYPNYGIGFGHQFWSTPREVFILFTSNAAHNDYLRLLVELGWFGVYTFYILLTAAVLIVWNSKACRRDPAIMQAYLGYLVLSITDNALATPCYFLLIVLAVFAATNADDPLRQPAQTVARPSTRRFGADAPAVS